MDYNTFAYCGSQTKTDCCWITDLTYCSSSSLEYVSDCCRCKIASWLSVNHCGNNVRHCWGSHCDTKWRGHCFALQGMPTGLGVGAEACYEFICCMARIAGESQPPTLSVCLRANGDLWVCICLYVFVITSMFLSLLTIVSVCWHPSHSRSRLLPFTSPSPHSSAVAVFFFFSISIVHLYISPHPLVLVGIC